MHLRATSLPLYIALAFCSATPVAGQRMSQWAPVRAQLLETSHPLPSVTALTDSLHVRRTYWLEGGIAAAAIGFLLGVTSRGDICEGTTGCKLGLGGLLAVVLFIPGTLIGGQIHK